LPTHKLNSLELAANDCPGVATVLFGRMAKMPIVDGELDRPSLFRNATNNAA
jgi:hypothetical protein